MTFSTQVGQPAKSVGVGVKRREDLRFLTGRGSFIDDVKLPGTLHAAILRSPYAHAKIKKTNTTKALQLPGVVEALTGKEVATMSKPFQPANPTAMKYYCMAVDKVRYMGEPVVAVAAVDRYIAEDALELVEVDYEPLPAVTEAEEAMKPEAPLLHEEMETNVAWHREFRYGDVDDAFRSADRVVSERLRVHRFSSTPIEPYGCIADFNKDTSSLTIWASCQVPGLLSLPILGALSLPVGTFRIITPDIGGGFGIKIGLPYMVLISLLGMKVGRPVKWVETRKEHLMGLQHGSDPVYDVEAAVRNDGTILGLKVRMIDNMGGYIMFPEPQGIIEQQITGCYAVRGYMLDAYAVMTNKCPTGPNRGYGRQHGFFMLERTVDFIAKRLGLDPAEVRFRNFIQPDKFPYRAPNGNLYDSGNYPETLKRALEAVGYDNLRKQQQKLRREGKYLGIGIATIIESGVPNFSQLLLISKEGPGAHLSGNAEACTVRISPSGKALVTTGVSPQGQGLETAIAQIAADELGVDPADVSVLPGFDTVTHAYTGLSGTYGSRFAGVVTGAVALASRQLREKMAKIAAHILRLQPADLDVAGGLIFARGSPEKALPVAAVAGAAYYHPLALPEGMEPGLQATCVHSPSALDMPDSDLRVNTALTYANSAHVAVVEVDAETGEVKILKYVVVEDCGNIINPMIVEGQVQGGVLHGIGGALFERLVYDENGQLLTSTLMDYPIPTSQEAPKIEVDHTVTPSPFTVLGAKGVGEGGAIGALPAVASAVEDALAPFNVKVTDSSLHPERILKQMARQ